MSFLLCLHLVQGSRFRGEVAASPPFFIGAMPESSILVTSRFYYTREGIVSHVWCQILRLSPHLFWLGGSHIERFRPFRMTIREERMDSYLGDMLRVLELTVLYYDTSSPLETEVPQRDFRVWPNPKRCLACPLRRLPVWPNGPRRMRRMDPRSGVKNYVGLSVSLKRHPDRSGGIFFADR